MAHQAPASHGSNGRDPRVLAIDAGGTMTDTFIVDRAGEFVVGKAQTTPEDESVGFMASTRDALRYWDIEPDAAHARRWCSGIYSGTAMLNRLLERKGRRVGLIVTGGHGGHAAPGARHPDLPRLPLLRPPSRRHPLPQRAARAARADPRRARADRLLRRAWRSRSTRTRRAPPIDELRDAGVEGIVVCLLYSYRNSEHEDRIARARRRARARAAGLPAPAELYPMRRDFPRLNSTLIEAYAAEPCREQLQRVRDVTREAGAGFDLRDHGRARRHDLDRGASELARTLISGPIGGVIGARYLATRLDSGHRANVVCTDIGGTSFDIALITDGDFQIKPDARHRALHAQPAAGAGGLDRRRDGLVRAHRPQLGPARARARTPPARRSACAGPRAGSRRRRSPTSTSCSAASTPTTSSAATSSWTPSAPAPRSSEQIAGPLGPRGRAGGRRRDRALRRDARATRPSPRCSGKGYSPVDYTLLCYGGGGPLHVAGYTDGRPLPRRARAGLGGRVLAPSAARAATTPTATTSRSTCRSSRRADDDEKAGIGMLRRRRLADAARARRRGVREVRRGREDQIEFRQLRAHAVLRPAQRPRDLLAAPVDSRRPIRSTT